MAELAKDDLVRMWCGGNLIVQAKEDGTLQLTEDGLLNQACNTFFRRFKEAGSWHSVATLRDMFNALKRKGWINDKIGLQDVIIKLNKYGVLNLRSRGRNKKNQLVCVYVAFTSYLNELGEEKPKNRSELLEHFEKKFPGKSRDVFHELVMYMKKKKIFKFTPGYAQIIYLDPKKRTVKMTGIKEGKAGQFQSTTNQAESSEPLGKTRFLEMPQNSTEKMTDDKAGQFQSTTNQAESSEPLGKTSDNDILVITNDNNPLKNGHEIKLIRHQDEEERVFQVTVTYNRQIADQPIEFTGYKLLDNADGDFTVDDEYGLLLPNAKKSCLFDANENRYELPIHYNSKSVGICRCFLDMEFKKQNNVESTFRLRLHGETTNTTIEDLKAKDEYNPFCFERDSYDPTVKIIRGIPPEIDTIVSGIIVPLEQYRIPTDIRTAEGDRDSNQFAKLKRMLNGSYRQANYKHFFHALLYLQELQMELDIQRYNLCDVQIKRCSATMELEVPGLMEGRQSILIGDKVYVKHKSAKKNAGSKVEYEGIVHAVERDRVLLKFNPSFVPGNLHDVRFTFKRGPLRLQHRALDLACHQKDGTVFPYINPSSKVSVGPLSEVKISNSRVFDRKIESNEMQRMAVRNILSGLSRPYPYIIYGPPGTGKTMTVIEAMRQVLNGLPKSRILACAPSNNVADLILHRLLNPCPIPKKQLFRLNAFSRSVDSLPEDIKDYCKVKDKLFQDPTITEIEAYRVVVCTMVTAGRLVDMGIGHDFFTHIFLDECAHSVEPEALVPLSGLLPLNGTGQIVLAGDPKQLGPVIFSSLACEYGLGLSLLQRLFDNWSHYKKSKDGKYDPKYITKLVINYRSHPDIIKIPNELFYMNELISGADEFKVRSLCQWQQLPAKDFPIIFHGMVGEDQREGNSPSFFNPHEASEVVSYVQSLLDVRSLAVTPDDIGIISPYNKQVSITKKFLKKKKIGEIKVGSVEQFQGQERRIIIISTVRSNKEYLKLDSEHRLGFLKNPKRFNVAVTRAQALLIVIGNPFVLSKDDCWKKLLDYCIKKGAYKGCRYSDNSEH